MNLRAKMEDFTECESSRKKVTPRRESPDGVSGITGYLVLRNLGARPSGGYATEIGTTNANTTFYVDGRDADLDQVSLGTQGDHKTDSNNYNADARLSALSLNGITLDQTFHNALKQIHGVRGQLGQLHNGHGHQETGRRHGGNHTGGRGKRDDRPPGQAGRGNHRHIGDRDGLQQHHDQDLHHHLRTGGFLDPGPMDTEAGGGLAKPPASPASRLRTRPYPVKPSNRKVNQR